MRMGWMLGSEPWRWRGEERREGRKNGVRYMMEDILDLKCVEMGDDESGMIPMKRILGFSL